MALLDNQLNAAISEDLVRGEGIRPPLILRLHETMAQIDESAISHHDQEAADERAPLLEPSSYRGNEEEGAEKNNSLFLDRENDGEAMKKDNAKKKQEH